MAHADRPHPGPTEAHRSSAALPVDASPLLTSSTLFAGGNQVRIAHQGQTYTLRITRENKLILTK